jgi:hydroxymethylglutaryl-CoA lyase
MAFPSHVRIMEVGPRDGLQILPEVLSVAERVELVERLADAGLRDIEAGSFVNPRAVPQMAESDAVFRALSAREGVQYHGLWLNARGLEHAIACDNVTVTGKLLLTATESFSKRNTNKSIAETLDGLAGWIALYKAAGIRADDLHVMAAFGCNFDGPVTVAHVMDLLDRGASVMAEHDEPFNRVCLADTMGWANPDQVRRMVGAVLDRWPDLRIKLHLHDTRGMALANAASAMELGVADFDSAVGGLGGCPFAGNRGAAGNACTEDLVFMCEEMGIDTGVDLDALIETARFAEQLSAKALPGKLMKSGGLAHYR